MSSEPETAPGPADPFARDRLTGAFGAAITDAAAAADGGAEVDAAVHALRKALRRARAIVRLVAGALPRADRRALARALVEARRLVAGSRDLAVVPVALGEVELDDQDRAVATAIVAAARDAAVPVDEVRAQLAEAAAAVAPLPDLLAAALPADLDRRDVAGGVESTYRRARRALRASRRSVAAFHAFRKRAKELTYQLELLAGDTDGKLAARRRALAELGDELGEIVDVRLLRAFCEAHAGDAPPDAVARLLDALDAELARRIKAARRRARPLFERKPADYARRVRRAAVRDHAPPAPAAPAAPADGSPDPELEAAEAAEAVPAARAATPSIAALAADPTPTTDSTETEEPWPAS